MPERELDRLSRGVHHQGAAAFAPPLSLVSLDTLIEDPALLGLALDEVQDPQNFGAVIRCAVGLGAAVIWGEHASAPLTPATFRASAGAIEHARLCRVRSLTSSLTTLAESGAQVVALDANAPDRLSDLDLRARTVLVDRERRQRARQAGAARRDAPGAPGRSASDRLAECLGRRGARAL